MPRRPGRPAKASRKDDVSYVSLPAGTGVWVVKTQRSRAAASASSVGVPARDLLGGELERGQRGMALVEVQDARLDAERAQRTHGPDAEQPRTGRGA